MLQKHIFEETGKSLKQNGLVFYHWGGKMYSNDS